MICAVIDPNVLVSALLSRNNNTATVQVMQKILNKEIMPLYNEIILQEYKAVLSRKKFAFDTN